MGSVAFLFAGQGAQHPAMGVDLIEHRRQLPRCSRSPTRCVREPASSAGAPPRRSSRRPRTRSRACSFTTWQRLRPARARRAVWSVHRARRPGDRGHVWALGYRRPGRRAGGCGGAEVVDRAHDINELSYPLPGETIARICEHMAGLPATPVCPRDGVLYVPRAMHASSICRVSMACLTRWSTLPSFCASRRPR